MSRRWAVSLLAIARTPNQATFPRLIVRERSCERASVSFCRVAATATCVGGEVGYAVNGVPIFDGFDAGGRDAVAWEIQDECHGHPQMTGVYHYHDRSSCVADAGSTHSALIGYARDGFGIYGYRGIDGKELTNADLDECHGHSHTITWDGKEVGMYHYHATREFPYTVGCFRGALAARTPTGG